MRDHRQQEPDRQHQRAEDQDKRIILPERQCAEEGLGKAIEQLSNGDGKADACRRRPKEARTA